MRASQHATALRVYTIGVKHRYSNEVLYLALMVVFRAEDFLVPESGTMLERYSLTNSTPEEKTFGSHPTCSGVALIDAFLI